MTEGFLEQLSTCRCAEDVFPRAYLKSFLVLSFHLSSTSLGTLPALALHRTEPVGTHGPLTKHRYYKDSRRWWEKAEEELWTLEG